MQYDVDSCCSSLPFTEFITTVGNIRYTLFPHSESCCFCHYKTLASLSDEQEGTDENNPIKRLNFATRELTFESISDQVTFFSKAQINDFIPLKKNKINPSMCSEIRVKENKDNLRLLPNHLKFISPPLAPTNSCKTHRAGLRLPGNVCGCRLPRSCGSRCHRTYTLLAEDFGSPRAQKSSATPSPTPLPFTSAAAERSGKRRGEKRKEPL